LRTDSGKRERASYLSECGIPTLLATGLPKIVPSARAVVNLGRVASREGRTTFDGESIITGANLLAVRPLVQHLHVLADLTPQLPPHLYFALLVCDSATGFPLAG
jgi:hypothetical protein